MALLETHCGHCGRDHTLTRIGEVLLSSKPGKMVGPDRYSEGPLEYQTKVEVARCENCGQPSFTQYGWLVPVFDSPEDALDVRTIYPVRRERGDLPPKVSDHYDSMLDLAHEPDAFAVRAGRCLEAVCADRGIPGKTETNGFVTLHTRLKKLYAAGYLPEGLANQAMLVKEYRNLGGHDGDVDPSHEDVLLIRDFVEAVLDFLYWGPAKLARTTEGFEKRVGKKAAKASAE